MIASCYSLSRIDRLLKVVRPLNGLANPSSQNQVWARGQILSCKWKISNSMNEVAKMDRHKKRKEIMHVWRPISTQSTSHEVDYDKGSDLQCQQPEGQKNKPTGVSDEQVFTQDESTSDTSMTLTTSSNIVDHDNHLEKLTTSSSIVDHASHLETIAGTFSKSHDSTTASISGENPEQITVEKGADLGSQDKSSSVSIEVDASLIRFIKGRGGSTQKQIEGDFGVKIVLPSSKEDCSIVVEGSIGSVAKASEKITRIIEEAVKSPRLDYSHFISLPLALHPELVEKLIRFQKSILGDAAAGPEDDLEHESNEDATDEEDNQSINQKVSVQLEVGDENKHVKVKMDPIGCKSTSKASILSDMGIEKSIFIKPKTFHLTVLMLKLWNKERIAMAAEVLQKISSKVLDALENQPVSVRLRGLACMKGSPAKARVVHAPVKEIGEEGRLLRACQVIIDAYVEAGLVLEKDAQQSLKLHATVMNARHRKRTSRRKIQDYFDARHIFRVYGSEDWGEYHIPQVHLSQRFKHDEGGYYHCCTSIPLPEKNAD
ncbi:uncharacterized protein LOC122014852 isoform X1 [Zingiber officinale]|uniref:uncharacterized protein LOC122014852 isoform X1 n=3 Tax=Zingiber officinale TaxID=94328 RepID=UPI001C4AFFFC|nr:uncharacterized protein LOC122014852 isoform X1 [Zingiber officinale]XP_042427253.1 uncharacterized protein LOC122014852 isoform X1 [Zingiber officinale]XP_042427254.1 uncharacterized protein LOC122014852 isoform X1 [Zingiber officinale]